jgi:hypothetical protein
MSPSDLIRWSGTLAIGAGASFILSPLLHPSSPQSAAWVPMHLLFFAALIVTLLALVGIFAYQLQQAGRLGLTGFFTAFVGTAMMLMEGREHLFSPDFGVGTPRGLLELIVASLVFSIGYIVLGTAITRGGLAAWGRCPARHWRPDYRVFTPDRSLGCGDGWLCANRTRASMGGIRALVRQGSRGIGSGSEHTLRVR